MRQQGARPANVAQRAKAQQTDSAPPDACSRPVRRRRRLILTTSPSAPCPSRPASRTGDGASAERQPARWPCSQHPGPGQGTKPTTRRAARNKPVAAGAGADFRAAPTCGFLSLSQTSRFAPLRPPQTETTGPCEGGFRATPTPNRPKTGRIEAVRTPRRGPNRWLGGPRVGLVRPPRHCHLHSGHTHRTTVSPGSSGALAPHTAHR